MKFNYSEFREIMNSLQYEIHEWDGEQPKTATLNFSLERCNIAEDKLVDVLKCELVTEVIKDGKHEGTITRIVEMFPDSENLPTRLTTQKVKLIGKKAIT